LQDSVFKDIIFIQGGGILLKGKTVVVGVCGGIAAYKAVELVSRLKSLMLMCMSL